MTGKTGSLGQPWVQLEPKPPAVTDRYAFSAGPPPERSAQCTYWLRQIERGWLPNRRLRAECCDCSAEWLGVYLSEYRDVIAPAIAAQIEQIEQAARC